MSYKKQIFVDGQTLSAGNLNYMEDGIVAAEQAAENKATASDLSAEITRAKQAEQSNANAISTEVARAKAAEKANTDAITAEKTRATGEEKRLDTAITTEADRAKKAETAISGRVDALNSSVQTLGLRVVGGKLCVAYTPTQAITASAEEGAAGD